MILGFYDNQWMFWNSRSISECFQQQRSPGIVERRLELERRLEKATSFLKAFFLISDFQKGVGFHIVLLLWHFLHWPELRNLELERCLKTMTRYTWMKCLLFCLLLLRAANYQAIMTRLNFSLSEAASGDEYLTENKRWKNFDEFKKDQEICKYFFRASFSTLDFKAKSLTISVSLKGILGSNGLTCLFFPCFSNNEIIKVVWETWKICFASVTPVIFGCFRSQNSTWICHSWRLCDSESLCTQIRRQPVCNNVVIIH